MPLSQCIAHMALLCRSASLGDLPGSDRVRRASVGALLATDAGLMQLLLRRDSLPTFLLELLEICLPRCFSSRFGVGIELVPVFGVVGQPATAIAGLAVRLAPTRLGAVDAEAFFQS